MTWSSGTSRCLNAVASRRAEPNVAESEPNIGESIMRWMSRRPDDPHFELYY